MLSGRNVVFLPGIDGTGISFEPLRPFIAQDTRVSVVRYPIDRQLDFEETVACAKDQMPTAGDAPVLMAESFSGPVAVRLVGAGDIRPQCLVLCSTFARSPRPLLWAVARHLPVAQLLKLPLPKCLLRRVIEGGEDTVDLFQDLWGRVKKIVPTAVLAQRLELVDQVDVRYWLPRITIPCLYIQASADRSVPAGALFDFVEHLPDLRVKRIRGPHFILQARPRESLSAIQAFLDRL